MFFSRQKQSGVEVQDVKQHQPECHTTNCPKDRHCMFPWLTCCRPMFHTQLAPERFFLTVGKIMHTIMTFNYAKYYTQKKRFIWTLSENAGKTQQVVRLADLTPSFVSHPQSFHTKVFLSKAQTNVHKFTSSWCCCNMWHSIHLEKDWFIHSGTIGSVDCLWKSLKKEGVMIDFATL